MLAKELDIELFLTGQKIDFNIPVSFQEEGTVKKAAKRKLTTIIETS